MCTLEQVCGGSSVFPTQDKTENMIMNLIMPLCLRVGSGRKGKGGLGHFGAAFLAFGCLGAWTLGEGKYSTSTAI